MRLAEAIAIACERILQMVPSYRLSRVRVRAGQPVGSRKIARRTGPWVVGVTCILYGASASAQTGPFTVIKVTNLNDSGPGSLRECVNQSGARVCVFEVSGRLKLATELAVVQPELIIAGQTAPSPGITITNAGITIRSHNVRIEHIAVRAGDDASGPNPRERDCVNIEAPGYNVVLKNMSISWGIDENFSTFGKVRNVTISDTIISEALHDSIHPKGPHSMGALVGEGARNVTFLGSVFAANNDRSARWKFDTTGEMVNNVIYGWGGTSSWNVTNLYNAGSTGPIALDVIGNVYLPGPNGLKDASVVNGDSAPTGTQVFLQDNIAPKLTNLSSKMIASARVVNTTAPRGGANTALASAMTRVGMRPWDRDPTDQRVLEGVANQTLQLRDEVGTWPEYSSNRREVVIRQSPIDLASLEVALKAFEGSGTPVPASPPAPPPPATTPAAPPATSSPQVPAPQPALPTPPTRSSPSSAAPTDHGVPQGGNSSVTRTPAPAATPTARPRRPNRRQVASSRRRNALCRIRKQTLRRGHPLRVAVCRPRRQRAG